MNGQPAVSGVYVYYIEYENSDGDIVKMAGSVTLI